MCKYEDASGTAENCQRYAGDKVKKRSYVIKIKIKIPTPCSLGKKKPT